MAEPEVGAARDPDARGQEAGVPPRRVVPDPADGALLPVAGERGQLGRREVGDLRRRPVVRALPRLDDALGAAHQDEAVHRRSVADGSDSG